MGSLRFADAAIVQVRLQKGVYVSHIIVTTQNLEQILLRETSPQPRPVLPLFGRERKDQNVFFTFVVGFKHHNLTTRSQKSM